MNSIVNVGTQELRTMYQRYVTESLMIAGLIHILLIGSYQMYFKLIGTELISIHKNLGGTISIYPMASPFNRNPTIPNINIAKTIQSIVGIPIPIPDVEINPDATIPTQEKIFEIPGGTIGVEDGTGTKITEGTVVERGEEPPREFIPGIEKYPIVISNPTPLYPDIARRAGVEGTVFIKMWVTKEGIVKSAESVKSTSDIFNQASIDAAMLWTFTPAIMDNKPISVWVTVPFKYRLTTK